MKINKNAWHYGVWKHTFRLAREPETTNLCSYCQRVFWGSLFALMMGGMLAFIAGSMLYAIFYLGFWQHPKVSFEVFSSFIVLCAAVWGFLAYKDYRQVMSFNQPAKPKSLFVQWLSAKKQKICPLVEFER